MESVGERFAFLSVAKFCSPMPKWEIAALNRCGASLHQAQIGKKTKKKASVRWACWSRYGLAGGSMLLCKQASRSHICSSYAQCGTQSLFADQDI